jgi:hypothetical protein
MSTKVLIKMARGGYMNLEVEGRVYPDSDGAGRKWTEVEIDSINWPGGGKVADKNIADMSQVEEALEAALKGRDEANYIDFCERYER